MNTLKKLFKSGYEGVIVEAGLGVPLQAAILSEAGASNFLLRGETPYNQEFQPRINDRSVSEQMAVRMADAAYSNAQDHGFPRKGKKLFSMAITGTHNISKVGAQSHAWICVLTDSEKFIVHAILPDRARKSTIGTLRYVTQDILYSALCGTMSLSLGFSVGYDVIRWPGMTMRNKMEFSGHHTLYFDKNGEMQRTADIIRSAKAVYRGSFNPPTKAHLAIGGDALFEISMNNSRKGMIENNDLIHRVTMLNKLGKGVLVTGNCPRFVQLAYKLEGSGGSPDIQYIMGADTFNRVCEDARGVNNLDTDKLKTMSLVVHDRNNATLDNLLTINLKNEHSTFSSTMARKGDHSGLDPVISDYIKQHKLYV